MPSTKPDLDFDEKGVCSACNNFQNRTEIDWKQREHAMISILDQYRSKDNSNYDCIVPVSGGKDSHFQVIKLLQLGFNPLCVTATTDSLSEIGRRNIENLKALGVDYFEVTTNPLIRRQINRLALTQIGDISWPEHVTIFTIPVRIAVQLNIPLIVWGENPQNEYGGPATTGQNRVLNRRWLEEFGGLLGLRVSDLVGREGISAKSLIQYSYPSDEDLQRVGVTGLFLGYFVPWDGYGNALRAQGYGFETYNKYVEGSLANYENLDNYQTGIHDYFKYLKYGFGRATDIACMHIRRRRLDRQEGIALARLHDGKFPWQYLGRQLKDILMEIDMTVDEFILVCDQFTNRKLFRTNNRGELIKSTDGSLFKINYDNI